MNQDKILKPISEWSGYPRIALWRDNVRIRKFVHHLVLEAFIGPQPKNHEADHKNRIRSDNRAENLGWVTRSYNMKNRTYTLHKGRSLYPDSDFIILNSAVLKMSPKTLSTRMRSGMQI